MQSSPASRILVVDDDALLVADVSRMLARLGHEVAGTATSGREAIALARSLKPDLILMDIALEGELDGIETARIITREQREPHIPIVFITASEDPATLDRAKLTDPYGYLIKPVERTMLHATLEVALHKGGSGARLQASEATHRQLVELLGDGVIIRDKNGIITFANDRFCEMLGYMRWELVGARLDSFIDRENRTRITAALTAQHAGQRSSFELELLTQNGSRLFAHVSASPIIQQAEDQPVYSGSIFSVTDLTTRRQQEMEKLAAEERFRHIFENATVGIYESSLGGALITVNGAMAAMFGFDSPEEMLETVKRPELQIFEDASEHANLLQRLHTEGEVQEFIIRAYGRDGDLFWISINARQVTDSFDQPIGIQGTVLDITAQKEAESAYQTTFELLNRTINAIPDLVAVTDADGNIILANAAMRTAFGHADTQETDDLQGRAYGKLMHGHTLTGHQHGALGGEGLVIHNPDTRRHYLVSRTPFSGLDGEEIGHVRVARDVTELIEREEALRFTERKFRSLFENAVDGIAHIDPTGSVLTCNRSFARMLGYPDPATVCASVHNAFTQLACQTNNAKPHHPLTNLAHRLLHGEAISGQLAGLTRADGSCLPVLMSARGVTSDLGTLHHVELFVTDNSTTSEQLAGLQEDTRFSRALLGAMPGIIFLLDAHGWLEPLNARLRELLPLGNNEDVIDLQELAARGPQYRQFAEAVQAACDEDKPDFTIQLADDQHFSVSRLAVHGAGCLFIGQPLETRL